MKDAVELIVQRCWVWTRIPQRQFHYIVMLSEIAKSRTRLARGNSAL